MNPIFVVTFRDVVGIIMLVGFLLFAGGVWIYFWVLGLLDNRELKRKKQHERNAGLLCPKKGQSDQGA